jgi:putative transposase
MHSARTHADWKNEDAVHFLTATTFARHPIFLEDRACELLCQEFAFYRDRYTVDLLAYVVMPDHFHALIFMNGNRTFMDFMKGVKGHFAKAYSDARRKCAAGSAVHSSRSLEAGCRDSAYNETIGGLPAGRRERAIVENVWQDGFFDYLVSSREKLREKLAYIVQNPVEAGLSVESAGYKWLMVDERFVNEYLSW